ncbi:MAG: nitrile hydratase subunit beta [Candidatus Binatia bacterium]
MDGIHDLGGVNGFGAVEIEKGEPVFHEPWEGLAFAMNFLGVAVLRAYNVDEYRHAIERMEPAHYLAAGYYERVLTGVASLLVERGVVAHGELESRAGGRFPLSGPVAPSPMAGLSPEPSARFGVGDRVLVRDIHPAGHTRVPRYCRGKRGVVVHVAPAFPFPDVSAHLGEHRPEHTYHVEFAGHELWAGADAGAETVVVDLWDAYLEAA